MFKNAVEKELGNVTYQIQMLMERLDKLPNGKLYVKKNGIYNKYYEVRNGEQRYLAKSEIKRINELKVKMKYEKMLDKLRSQELILTQYLALDESDIIYNQDVTFESDDDYVTKWLKEEYSTVNKHTEGLIYETISGHVVRSKSEVIICTALYNNKIPFKYEAPLKIGDRIIYPDFTAMHPRTHKIYYWEHFGMMSDEDYKSMTAKKIATYIKNDIIPTINLIATYETDDMPINVLEIENIIKRNFLN